MVKSNLFPFFTAYVVNLNLTYGFWTLIRPSMTICLHRRVSCLVEYRFCFKVVLHQNLIAFIVECFRVLGNNKTMYLQLYNKLSNTHMKN